MRKTFALILIGGMLLPTAAAAAPAPFKTQFCPEEWQYLYGPGALDMKGNCGVCGRYPVELEAQAMTWNWCARKKAWLRAPCAENWMRRCCTAEESLAAVVAVADAHEGFYCPACRDFDVYRLPILQRMVCKNCARPAVLTDVVDRAWYRCSTEGIWNTAPCARNPVEKCCTKRHGLLLAKPDPGPIAQ
jgi:hypothetical protein